MRILVAHNRYREPGGEDVVFEQEVALLRKHRHDVIAYERRNEELDELPRWRKIQDAARAIWSSAAYEEFIRVLRATRPEVVHVHNTFLRFSPSVFQACRDAHVPVVHTLHNYRLLCPATNAFRDGQPCDRCSNGNLWPAVTHGCYRNSRPATALAAATIALGRHRQVWTKMVNHLIAPSAFLKFRLVTAGHDPEHITVKPHFVNDDPGVSASAGDYAVFMGRLSPEKGLDVLLEAWRSLKHIPLRVIGDGPERGRLQESANSAGLPVSFEGQMPRAGAIELLRRARLLVFPSLAYESFGMSIIEAFACGVPVIASAHGAMRELVSHGTGLLFPPGDPAALARAVNAVWSDAALQREMSACARREYESKYTAEMNYTLLMNIYERVLSAPSRQVPVAAPAAA